MQLKIMDMGFVQNRPISVTVMNFLQIHSHSGQNRGYLKPTFPDIVVGRFLNSWVVITAIMNLYFLQDVVNLISIVVIL